MSKPKWHEAWQEAFEEGSDDLPGERINHPLEKKAVSVRKKADGTTEIVKVATGVEAQKMIAEAQSKGMAVEQNTTQVESLMKEQNGATDVPPEVYRLMSSVIDFAQELCQEWKASQEETLEAPIASSTEIDYTLDDIPG